MASNEIIKQRIEGFKFGCKNSEMEGLLDPFPDYKDRCIKMIESGMDIDAIIEIIVQEIIANPEPKKVKK